MDDGIPYVVLKYENDSFSDFRRRDFDVYEYKQIISYYLENGQLEKSLKVINEAKEIYPASEEILKVESQILIELGYWKAAERRLKYLLVSDPDDMEVATLLGIAYAKLGLIDEALPLFDSIIKSVPHYEKTSILFEIAQIFINTGRFDIAQKYLLKAYKHNPKEPNVILDLAYCFEKNGELDRSEEFYTKYLKINPFSKLAWYNLGIVYTKLQQKDKALEALDFAIAIDPEFLSALVNKGFILYEKNKLDEAKDCFDKVLSLNPGNATVNYFVAEIYFKQKKYAKSIAVLKKILEKERDFAEAWFLLAKISHRLGKRAHSKKFLKNALNLDSKNFKFWSFAPDVFENNFNFEMIDKIFRKLTLKNFHNPAFWKEYSKFLIKIKNFPTAIKTIKNSIALANNNPNYFYVLGQLFNKIGNKQKAKYWISKAYRLNPELIKNKQN